MQELSGGRLHFGGRVEKPMTRRRAPQADLRASVQKLGPLAPFFPAHSSPDHPGLDVVYVVFIIAVDGKQNPCRVSSPRAAGEFLDNLPVESCKVRSISVWYRTHVRLTKPYADALTRLQGGIIMEAKKGALNRGALGKVVSLCSFVHDLTAEKTELCSRPEMGFSELAGTLDNFFVTVEELGGGLDFNELAQKTQTHQLSFHLRVLNTMFKSEIRSSEEIQALSGRSCSWRNGAMAVQRDEASGDVSEIGEEVNKALTESFYNLGQRWANIIDARRPMGDNVRLDIEVDYLGRNRKLGYVYMRESEREVHRKASLQVIDPKYFACARGRQKDYGTEGSSASSDLSPQQSDLYEDDWGTEALYHGADEIDERVSHEFDDEDLRELDRMREDRPCRRGGKEGIPPVLIVSGEGLPAPPDPLQYGAHDDEALVKEVGQEVQILTEEYGMLLDLYRGLRQVRVDMRSPVVCE
ncbi:unnamed protein product, partial [Symbiodinium microadriaticum]